MTALRNVELFKKCVRMCRMMAKAAAIEESIFDEMTACPHSMRYLSEHGRLSSGVAARGEHRDGCGFAYFNDGKLIRERRGSADVWDASYIDAVRAARSTLFLAHDRKASPGLYPDVSGAHPILAQKNGVDIAFCHNGSVHSYMKAAAAAGTTDTAQFFDEILHSMQAVTPQALATAVSAISKETDFSSLTAMAMTKHWLCVWRLYSIEVEAEKREQYDAYYTMHYLSTDHDVVFASEPLDENTQWRPMPNRSFITIDPAHIADMTHANL